MTEFDPKKYLNQIRHIDSDIRSRQEEISRLRNAITMKTSTIRVDTVQESHAGSYDDKYLKLLERDEELNDKVDKLVDTKIHISNVIDLMDDRAYRIILREKYLNLKTFEQLAALLHYDISWIHHLHGKALKQFKESMLLHINR